MEHTLKKGAFFVPFSGQFDTINELFTKFYEFRKKIGEFRTKMNLQIVNAMI